MALQTISESVYMGLCLHIGTSQQVAIRKDLIDFHELLECKVLTKTSDILTITSGSRREGFIFSDSDLDYMFWYNNQRVIWNISQIQLCNTLRHVLILCDTSESPPGFTLLCLPSQEAIRRVFFRMAWTLLSCVRFKGTFYISSAKYRNNTCHLINTDSTVHGPCSSGSHCSVEYDKAHCFVSDFWPPPASSWIDRCHSWPPPNVVNDIVRGGCHFVEVGHKFGKHADNEWRISFSQAEQKLVYAMNHTQFLTYGLLKLFLKEFNNGLNEEEKLLCSYHMKTANFWTIQQKTLAHWSPQNLLAGFWVCFKLLLKWVYEGVCPNFFIPENNMFLNKVHGEAQKKLFTQLYGLYEKGITFLLQSPHISPYIMDVLCNPRLSISTDESTLISEIVIDIEILNVIDQKQYLNIRKVHGILEYLHEVKQLISSPLTSCQIAILQKLTATILQYTAFKLHNMYNNASGVNKNVYIADKGSCYMLKLAAKFGYISDLLYVVMYYYKTFRHREALSIIEMTKGKLAQPGLMYKMLHVDPERYTQAVGGHSWTTKMRHVVGMHVILHNEFCYIPELTLEQQTAVKTKCKHYSSHP